MYPDLADPFWVPATPNIGALASGGLRLDRMYATGLCSPTRACYLTGRYPFRSGIGCLVVEGAGPLQDSDVTIAEVLQQHGYRTAFCGKWHLGNSQSGGLASANLAGFQFASGSMANFGDGTGFYSWPWFVNGVDRGLCLEYATTQATNDALAFIRRAGDEPWFCYVGYHASHAPHHTPPPGTYDEPRWGLDPDGPPSPPLAAETRPYFKAATESLDHHIGLLLGGMRAAVRENTLVIYLSDNGTSAPQIELEVHPLKGPYQVGAVTQGKRTIHEPGIRVACAIQGAGVSSPGRVHTGIQHVVDLFRLIASAAEISARALAALLPPGRILDSVDFTHVLRNTTGPTRSSAYTELFSPNQPNGGTVSGVRTIVGERYKLALSGVVDAGHSVRFWDLEHLEQVSAWEITPGADLTPGNDTSGLDDADPDHPGELSAFNALNDELRTLVASFDDDLGT
jgi:arylsulfatase A-like enzyme